jgi:membrane protease YdiL (CAAX protease family)
VHWGFLATVLWGVGIAVIFTMAQSLAVIVAVIVRAANLNETEFVQQVLAAEKDGTLLSIATYCSTIVAGGAIAIAVATKHGATLRDYLNLKPVSIRTALLWIGGLVVVLVLSDLLTGALNKPIVPEFVAAIYKTADPVWTIWAATVIAAPLFEETFFRGFLFKGFEASVIGPAGAVLLTSALWAGIHLQYDLYGIASIFVLGLIIGSARVFTGSLYLPLAMHAVTNLIATAEAAAWG